MFLKKLCLCVDIYFIYFPYVIFFIKKIIKIEYLIILNIYLYTLDYDH